MKKLVVALFVLGLFSGCTIKHPVAKDYSQFLSANANAVQLPKSAVNASYLIDGKTEQHRYEFRAVTVGYAHLWIVEFGKILDQTLSAPYVQTSFGKLAGPSPADNVIEFSLEKYEFKDYRAYVSMRVKSSKGGQSVIDKTYSSEGNSQGGQMWGAGPFGMKNATLDSTKSAIDKILREFLNDMSKT